MKEEINMIDRRGDTKNNILGLARSLMIERGFNGFSYKNISSLLGIKNAAVHYHYPSKTDLGVEIILRERIRFQDWTAEIDRQDLSPSQKMEAFLGKLRELLESEDSFFAAVVEVNFNFLPEVMQEEAKMLIFGYISWLETVLRKGREDGEFSYQESALEKAHMIFAILSGAIHLEKVVNRSCIDTVIGQVGVILKR